MQKLPFAILCWAILHCPFFPIIVTAAASPVTDLAQLENLAGAESERGKAHPVDLEATVWYANPRQGKAILTDNSGSLFLTVPLPNSPIVAGEMIRLQGEAAIAQMGSTTTIKPVPFIDNDGLHGELERSRETYLEAGFYPIFVEWFNAIGEPGLIIEIEGPQLERQRLPASFLIQNIPDESTAAAPGLSYKAYHGRWWALPPSLNSLKPFTSGITNYFDVTVAQQKEFVAASFEGFLRIQNPGHYTFHLLSDDGSRLFLGERNFQSTTTSAHKPLPSPINLRAGQSIDPPSSPTWTTITGRLEKLDPDADEHQITLSTDLAVTRITVSNTFETNRIAENQLVAATGVLVPHTTLDGQSIAGELLVQSFNQISFEPEEIQAESVIPISQIEKLTPAQLKTGYSTRIQGVVTNSIAGGYAIVLQDESRAIFVDLNQLRPDPIKRGELLIVEGKVEPGEYSPFLNATQIERRGMGVMPEPLVPTREEILNGSLHSQYVEITGYLLALDQRTLTLRTRAGILNVSIETTPNNNWLNSVLRLRGCLRSFWDPATREIVVGKMELNSADIQVIRQAPSELFDVSKKEISNLLRFDPNADVFQRVGVQAQVLLSNDEHLYLTEKGKGLRATLVETPPSPLSPGDIVELVGFPEFDGPAPHFAHAMLRKLGSEPLPQPDPILPENALSDHLDSTLVSIESELVGIGIQDNRWTLQLRSGSHVFAASLLIPVAQNPGYEVGSQLVITGVFVGLGGNRSLGQPIEAFEILVGSLSDIAILSTPPWWTGPRLLMLMGFLCIIILLAFLWIKSLQSQVAHKTNQLREVLEERHRVEQEEALARERSRLAYDLHDELGAGLTEVGLLGTLAATASLPIEKRDTHLKRLSDKVRHLVMSLDEIVWAVNPKYDSVLSFVSYYTSYAQQFLSLANITCRFDIAEDIPEEPLTARVRHSLFLCYKEALTNVVRHADATEVIIRLFSDDRQLVVAISDNGRGLQESIHNPGTDGLASMKERLDNLGGFCEIESNSYSGTTVTLKLPLK